MRSAVGRPSRKLAFLGVLTTLVAGGGLIAWRRVIKGAGSNQKILCWIPTHPDNHLKRAIHVKRTWGQRCDELLFVSSAKEEALGSVALTTTPEGYRTLWGKTREALKHMWVHYGNTSDWFFRADDDTYVVMENLREFLHSYSPYDPPLYIGVPFQMNPIRPGFLHSGAGFVLSRQALKRLIEEGLPDPEKCPAGPEGADDVTLADCVRNLGIQAVDARYEPRHGRFLPEKLRDFLRRPTATSSQRTRQRYLHYSPPERNGWVPDDTMISWHYVDPEMMYVSEYLVYKLRKPEGL